MNRSGVRFPQAAPYDPRVSPHRPRFVVPFVFSKVFVFPRVFVPSVFVPGTATACATAILLTACGPGPSEPSGTASNDATVRCYELVEGGSRTVIKVEPAPNAVDAQGGQVTVYSFRDGTEEFPPETTAGRLEPSAFVYADGTTLTLREESLTWPRDSMLEGAVFTATSCP